MKRKAQLKRHQKYEKVYIHPDQSAETRTNNNNLKMLISALGVSGLKMKGSRLVVEGPGDKHSEEGQDNNNIERDSRSDARSGNLERRDSYKRNESRRNYQRPVESRQDSFTRVESRRNVSSSVNINNTNRDKHSGYNSGTRNSSYNRRNQDRDTYGRDSGRYWRDNECNDDRYRRSHNSYNRNSYSDKRSSR